MKDYDIIINVLEREYSGSANAAPIDWVVEDLIREGVVTSRRHFQLRVKPALLALGRVVGACERGVFLCNEPADFGLALGWYQKRIASEQAAMAEIVKTLVANTANPS